MSNCLNSVYSVRLENAVSESDKKYICKTKYF